MIEVVQFKYSIAREIEEMRASDIKKTLQKFAATDTGFIEQVGSERVDLIVRYEIVANRPFCPALIDIFEGVTPAGLEFKTGDWKVRDGKSRTATLLPHRFLKGNPC